MEETKEINGFTEAHREKFIKRIMLKVVKGKTEDDCWIWAGAMTSQGYGNITIRVGKNMVAHRIVYALLVGGIPKGKFILHSCDIRNCVNPKHLRIGTTADNMRDRVMRSPKGINKKLNPEEVIRIRKARKEGIACEVLAKKYGVCAETISAAATGKKWKCVRGEEVTPTQHPVVNARKVRRIRELRRKGYLYRQIAGDCGVSEYTVGRIVRGERHKSK